ncbi:MAG: hypothetical protein ABSD29_05770 [Verrucomicrobiota bacterium]|jgi:hypothetical protein
MNKTSVVLIIALAGSLALARGQPATNAAAAAQPITVKPPPASGAPATNAAAAAQKEIDSKLNDDLEDLSASLTTLNKYLLRSPDFGLTAAEADLDTLGKEFVILGTHLADSNWSSAANDEQDIKGDLPKLKAHLAPPTDLVSLADELAGRSQAVSATGRNSKLGTDLHGLGTNLVALKVELKAAKIIDLGNELSTLAGDLKPASNQLKGAAPPPPKGTANAEEGGVLRGDLSTNLVNMVTNTAVLGTNLMILGTNLTDVGTSISLNGTNAPALGTNTLSFGTNLVEIGTNVERLGATLAMPHRASIPYAAFLSSGATFKGTYNVHVTNSPAGPEGYLDNSGDNIVGFLEFDYISRYVFRQLQPGEVDHEYNHGNWFGFKLLEPWKHAPDIETRIGFTFANSTGPSNYTASTIVGSGDFYTDVRVGVPLFRRTTPNQRQQISLEGEGGFSTDTSFLEVHPTAFVGLGYQTSFRPVLGASSTNVCGFLSGRLGAGWIDVPSTTTSPTPGVTGVTLDSGGLPVFHLDPSPCMSVLLVYPITGSLFLVLDANTYIRHAPADWTVSVGLSIPLGKVSSIITSPFTSASP